MSRGLDAMLQAIGHLPARGDADAAFGRPAKTAGRAVLPAAEVCYEFELDSKREGPQGSEGSTDPGESDQGRATIRSRPIALIEIGSRDIAVRPVLDLARIAPSALFLLASSICGLVLAIAIRSRRGK